MKKDKIPNYKQELVNLRKDLSTKSFLLSQYKFESYVDSMRYEDLLDKVNGDYGTKKHYCLFCKSNLYNSQVGIIHNGECIILELRRDIKHYEKVNRK